MRTRRRITQTLFHRLYCLLMAFYVINISIDAPDGYVKPDALGEYREDLAVNDIESIGELILESWLDITNAVPEHDEPVEGDNTVLKIVLDWSVPSPPICFQFLPVVNYRLQRVYIPFQPLAYLSASPDITTPPPRRLPFAAKTC